MKSLVIPMTLLLALSVPAVAQNQTWYNNRCYSRCARSSCRCRSSRPPNWWRHLLACSAEKRASQYFVIAATFSQLDPAYCGAFFASAPNICSSLPLWLVVSPRLAL